MKHKILLLTLAAVIMSTMSGCIILPDRGGYHDDGYWHHDRDREYR